MRRIRRPSFGSSRMMLLEPRLERYFSKFTFTKAWADCSSFRFYYYANQRMKNEWNTRTLKDSEKSQHIRWPTCSANNAINVFQLERRVPRFYVCYLFLCRLYQKSRDNWQRLCCSFRVIVARCGRVVSVVALFAAKDDFIAFLTHSLLLGLRPKYF